MTLSPRPHLIHRLHRRRRGDETGMREREKTKGMVPTALRIAEEITTTGIGHRCLLSRYARGREIEIGSTSGGAVLVRLLRRIGIAGIRLLLEGRLLHRIRGRGGMMEDTKGGEEVPEEGLGQGIEGQWIFFFFK